MLLHLDQVMILLVLLGEALSSLLELTQIFSSLDQMLLLWHLQAGAYLDLLLLQAAVSLARLLHL